MAIWENVVNGEVFGYDALSGYIPEEDIYDLDVILDTANWELNTCPDYRERFFRPLRNHPAKGMCKTGSPTEMITSGLKELTINPGAEVVIRRRRGIRLRGGTGPRTLWVFQLRIAHDDPLRPADSRRVLCLSCRVLLSA